MSTPLRVRFCPAPSGWLHVGSARTALFNWLWARHHDGAFILRIEDTDAERATIESAEGMMAALAWLGLTWDEGPAVGTHAAQGDHGPYLQSQRRPLHDAVVARLVDAGHAYEAFETTEELEEARADGAHVYAGGHRDLTEDQRAAFRAEGRQPVVRLRTPDEGSVSWEDAVRGTVTFDWTEIGDFVIARADGSPTYMLANVVDDLSQGIGFVARGEDLLSATPRQILLASLLVGEGSAGAAAGSAAAGSAAGSAGSAAAGSGLLDEALAAVGYPPREADWATTLDYAHMPLLVGEDRKKLSKRHGAVAIDAFRDDGFLPETMVNFLALCGWSPGGDREQMTVEELVEAFTFDRVQSSPAFFDTDKLRSLNGDAIKALTDEAFAQRLVPVFEQAGVVASPATGEEVAVISGFAPHLKDRVQTLAEAVPFVRFAFSDEVEWDEKAVAKWLNPAAGPVLDHVTPALAALEEWTAEAIMGVFEQTVAELEVGMGKAMQPVRVVVTGSAVSPPLPETLAVLDQGWVLFRLRAGRSKVAEG